jgi:hypothetical protein
MSVALVIFGALAIVGSAAMVSAVVRWQPQGISRGFAMTEILVMFVIGAAAVSCAFLRDFRQTGLLLIGGLFLGNSLLIALFRRKLPTR